MLSTTNEGVDRSIPRNRGHDGRQGGQILVIFAGGLIAFLAIAALVFDVGQNLLDWRAQRDAADAAALAGSRYIADPACVANPSIVNCPAAYQAAIEVARLNGYGDVDGDGTDDRGRVDIHIPPQAGRDPIYVGQPGFIEVNIHTDRPSFFAAVLGLLRQNVDAMAIAGNSDSVAPPYSMLALNDDCDPNPSGQVGGNGDVTVDGPIVINSKCDGALLVNGNGALSAPECSVAGTVQESGANASLDCPVVPFDGTGDPLVNMGQGAMPGNPAPVQILSWNGGGTPTIPAGCPGSTSLITLVGSSIVPGDSATLPAFAGGDVAVVFAYRSGSITPPDLPAGWTDIVSDDGADPNSRRIGYRTLDGTETTSGTWTNATGVAVIVLRGQDADVTVGARASVGAPGSTMMTPALSGIDPGGHSWVIAFGGATSGANLTTLAGTTPLSTSLTPPLALHYAADTISWSAQDYGGGPVTGPNRTDAVEIRANPNPSTAANPAGCTLSGAGGGRYNIFRIHPGVYYGGIQLSGQRARVYMAPGTYWLAGGGLSITGGNNQLISVDGTSSTTPGRGVFIYVTEDEYYEDECAAVPPTAPAGACIGGISARGNSSNDCPNPPQPSLGPQYTPNPPTQPCAWVHLEPTDSPIENLLVFVDRSLTANIEFNGDSGKTLELSGTIYNPNGDVKINGGADDTVAAQIISYTFHVTGNGGFTVTYDSDGVVQLSGVGLVQ